MINYTLLISDQLSFDPFYSSENLLSMLPLSPLLLFGTSWSLPRNERFVTTSDVITSDFLLLGDFDTSLCLVLLLSFLSIQLKSMKPIMRSHSTEGFRSPLRSWHNSEIKYHSILFFFLLSRGHIVNPFDFFLNSHQQNFCGLFEFLVGIFRFSCHGYDVLESVLLLGQSSPDGLWSKQRYFCPGGQDGDVLIDRYLLVGQHLQFFFDLPQSRLGVVDDFVDLFFLFGNGHGYFILEYGSGWYLNVNDRGRDKVNHRIIVSSWIRKAEIRSSIGDSSWWTPSGSIARRLGLWTLWYLSCSLSLWAEGRFLAFLPVPSSLPWKTSALLSQPDRFYCQGQSPKVSAAGF